MTGPGRPKPRARRQGRNGDGTGGDRCNIQVSSPGAAAPVAGGVWEELDMEAGSSLTPASFDTGIVVGDGARFGLGGAGLTLCGGTERWRASAGARTRADLERRACQRGGQSRAERPRGPGCGLRAAGCCLLARRESKMWRGGQWTRGRQRRRTVEKIQELLEPWGAGIWSLETFLPS